MKIRMLKDRASTTWVYRTGRVVDTSKTKHITAATARQWVADGIAELVEDDIQIQSAQKPKKGKRQGAE